MNKSNFWSSVLHAAAGVVVFAGVFAVSGIPDTWQAMTVGGLVAAVVKWAQLYLKS